MARDIFLLVQGWQVNFSGLLWTALCSCKVYYRDWKNTCKPQVQLEATAKEIFLFSSFITHIKGEAGLFPPTEMGTRKTWLHHFPKQAEFTTSLLRKTKAVRSQSAKHVKSHPNHRHASVQENWILIIALESWQRNLRSGRDPPYTREPKATVIILWVHTTI